MACLLRSGLLLVALLLATVRGEAQALLASPFSDHGVLQRDAPIPVWGEAAPGAMVQVTLGRHSARTRTDSEGRWRVALAPMAAGGPHVLEARAGEDVQQARDVLVGDVWLCSGQSNMELQVHRALDARAEIAAAGNDRIRLLQVPKASSPVPLARAPGALTWQPVTSQSVREFSAACYFFARELQKSVDVPMGLIHAAWGGSRIEAWISGDRLRQVGGHAAALDVLAQASTDPAAAVAGWGAIWEAWWRQHAAEGADFEADGEADVADAPWAGTSGDWTPAQPSTRWVAPTLAQHIGQAWYRASFTLDPAQASQAATLELGPVDEIDMTWLNGHAVGSASGADTPRAYPVPAGRLVPGTNHVVVNVLNTYREGGIGGGADSHALVLADGTRVALQHWGHRAVPTAAAVPPTAPWMATSGLGTLYNGMVSPLAGFGLRGVAWYQGESHTGEPEQYPALLRAYRDDLRTWFGADLPLLVVQLANFGAAPTAPGESGWAALREAQRHVAADDERSGLVVAIDLGERTDIHPANKQEIGRRLARAARHVVYGDAASASGPVPVVARHQGGAVLVRFAQISGQLVTYGGTGPVGFALCGSNPVRCRYADARIEGDTVVLQAPDAHTATRVRFGWADSPVTTLYDADGLPAGPFEIPIQ